MHRISCCWGSNGRKFGFRITGRKFGFRITGSKNRKGCKVHLMNSSFMDRLPSNIIFDIFSRVPVKCLARSRCVSKVWCNYIDDPYLLIIHDKRVVDEPTPILYHQHLSRDRTTHRLCFHVNESKQTGTTDYVLEPKKGTFFEYLHKKPLSESLIARIEVRGSCNGLMCLSQDEDGVVTTFYVVHPLRKECYKLPPTPLLLYYSDFTSRSSCGLGFDASTNTLKMVCVLFRESEPSRDPYMARKKLCTMVHVIGTNSWREIPQVPSYLITGNAIFANGCLHWLVSFLDIKTEDGGRHVIWFNVEKEEFGLVDPPKKMFDKKKIDIARNYSCYKDQLVDLNGEVGYVCGWTWEVWVLKQKEWVPHCRIDKEDPYDIEVMGCWNKDGDILLLKVWSWEEGPHGFVLERTRSYAFFVYNLKSGVFHKLTNIDESMNDGLGPNFIMYPNTLSSIHGINKNSFSMKKTYLKKSCRHLLSNFH